MVEQGFLCFPFVLGHRTQVSAAECSSSGYLNIPEECCLVIPCMI